jgi:ABC-type multidrug transport system permease subunit
LTNLATLTRTRMKLALRNKMFFFFSVIMPLGFFFLYAGIFAKGDPKMVLFYLGPVLALNVMGSFWGLSATLVMYRFVFHVPNFGNIWAMFLFVCVGTVSFGSLGLVVASVTNTMQETQVLNQLLWLPLIFLSGATLPVAFLSKAVQRAALFLPATYLVSGLQQATYASQSITMLLTQFVSLVAWAALSFFVATQLFRWEPEIKIPRSAKIWAVATVIPFILLGFWEQYNGRILAEARAAFSSATGQSAPHSDAPKN